jgi:hypothetical protein
MNTLRPAPALGASRRLLLGGPLLALAVLLAPQAVSAAAKIKIAKAAWSEKAGALTITGKAKNGAGAIDIYDINGRRLGGGQGDSFALKLSRQDLAGIPCAVRVQSGGTGAIKRVKGAPKSCAGVPTCSITSPADGASLQIGVPSHFQAEASSPDPTAQPLQYEWDFAGGAMGHPTELMAMPTFIRDNSHYRVRFSATDAKGRRCEDTVEVAVGTPPSGLPAKVPEQEAPRLGSELDGAAGDVAVLPFQEWSMQHEGDMKSIPNGYMSFVPLVNNLRAYAFKKDRLPVFLDAGVVELRYSAASNPSDPVGAGSINSTSQNWPLDAMSLTQATVQKTDIWDTVMRTDLSNVDTANYRSTPWIMDPWRNGGLVQKDEGLFKYKAPAGGGGMGHDHGTEPDNDPNNSDHGRFMPGKADPYKVNEPQPFSKFVAANQAGEPAGWFSANLIPKTGIDDRNRVNPFTLLRVEAVQKDTGAVLAKTDGVLSSGRDLHCRECHAKGGIAAPENPPHTKAACRSSGYGAISDGRRARLGRVPFPPCEDKPRYFSVADFGGDPDSLFDQEYAAALNYSSIHEFYDGIYFLTTMQKGVINSRTGLVTADRPMNCDGCHFSVLNRDPYGKGWHDGLRNDIRDPSYYPNYSVVMHRFHGELQWNADKTGILRDEKGAFVRFGFAGQTRRPNTNLNPNTLYPIFDGNGKQLPMEENCLKCHGGQREQHYRDRMYTAGVTCYDCHGDMLAVGGAFTKTTGTAGVQGDRLDAFRIPWFDETDCGSCHTGKGGEAVLKTAIDELSPAQMTRAVDLSDPAAARFAVVPRLKREVTVSVAQPYDFVKDSFNDKDEMVKIDAPVFREGKDSHGNVACAACHGAAHAIWPNRDPSANDNLTALQLQGHAGTILECNVCHTADAFKNKDDLDGGQYSGDPVAGILGGPHNTHPINDPYWWKEAPGDSANSDGTTYGGWHNDYAKLPGKNGEDQCAACHGADHKGTRLSKTPVARVFDFRGFDGKKLKKAGFKSRVIRVAAGTPIGCDTCHSLETSFKGSPGR